MDVQPFVTPLLQNYGVTAFEMLPTAIFLSQFGAPGRGRPSPVALSMHPQVIVQSEFAGAISRERLGNTRGIFRPSLVFHRCYIEEGQVRIFGVKGSSFGGIKVRPRRVKL